MKTLLACILLLPVCFSSMKCEKENPDKKPELPAETQTGKDTFGCLVNGEVWLPEGIFPYSSLNAQIQFNILSINARQANASSIHLGIYNLNGEGQYSLKSSNNRAFYVTDSGSYELLDSGTVIITKYNTTNKVIAGRFSFKAKNDDGEMIEITDGRFDLKYTD